MNVPAGAGLGGNPGEDSPVEGNRTRRGEDRSQAAGNCIRSKSESEE